MRELITHDELINTLEYSVVTGEFYWLKAGSKRHLNKIAGSATGTRYRHIQLKGVFYLNHRLAWFYIYKEWPAKIDHINRNSLCNGWHNIRSVTQTQNLQNVLKQGKHGRLSGAYQMNNNKRYFSKIVVKGQQVYLGTFETEEEAHEAYKEASLKYFGEFSPFYKSSR